MNHYVLSIGANLGQRHRQLVEGLRALQQGGVEILRWSRLFETAPVGVLDQPHFLNAAVWCRSVHNPLALLGLLKRIEYEEAGRDPQGKRWGPRPLDMDIVAFNGQRFADPALTVPHPRWFSRDFVLAPLADLISEQSSTSSQSADVHDVMQGRLRVTQDPVSEEPTSRFHTPEEQAKARGLVDFLRGARRLYEHKTAADRLTREAQFETGQPPSEPPADCVPVVPVPSASAPDRVWSPYAQPHVMGILNITPDSFSDGGQHYGSLDAILTSARQMVMDGATVLDVGGQSTRPGAVRLSVHEECARVVPVIEALARDKLLCDRGVLLSVDTFYAGVAAESARKGAHMINDVSAGALDPAMHATMADLDTAYVVMHMRGDPTSMQTMTHYRDVVQDAALELARQCSKAVSAGVAPWNMILDPGIGFAKDLQGNVDLIRGLQKFREPFDAFGGLRNAPMLVGPSRKGFLGTLTGQKDPKDRDVATAAACVVSHQNGGNIFRVHNVRAASDALQVSQRLQRSI